MRTPDELVSIIGRRLETGWHEPDRADRWPLRIPLRTAGKADAERDFPTVHAWASTWQSWAADKPLTLEWANRRVHGTSQPLPTHVVVADAESAATVIGDSWPARVAQARTRRTQLGARFPDLDPGPIVRQCWTLTDVDFALLLDAAEWFANHDAEGLSPRQVPIPGLHAKWLDAHDALVRRLTGRDDLGLTSRPGVVRFAHLDPEHLAAGKARYGAVTIVHPDAGIGPGYLPTTVIIVENLDTMLYFPPLPGGIAVWGSGSAATLLPRLAWIAEAPHAFYWGDIDTHGLEILDRLRADGIDATSILMDLATLKEYEEFHSPADPGGRPLGPRSRKDTPHLNGPEQAAYDALTSEAWPGPWRLEQERIPLNVGHAVLAAALNVGTR